jgi:hypothetical protein
MIEKEFQMSMMRELTFFSGIKVKQIKKGTFVHQAKYTKDLMKKFNMAELKLVSTPMSMTTALDPNENDEVVDQMEYRRMIGSLLYLMATRRTFSSLCACVHAFKLPHALHIEQSFSGFLGISNTHLNLECGILLLHRLILLAFPMLILRVVGLTKKALLVHVIFLIFSCFWSAHKQSSVAQSTTKAKYVAVGSCCSQILCIVHTMRDYGVIYKSVPLM